MDIFWNYTIRNKWNENHRCNVLSLLDNINFWINNSIVCFIINIHLCKFVQFAEIGIFLFVYLVYISSFADRIDGLSWVQTEGGWDEPLYNGVSTQDS